jgi:predicted deacetylase
MSIQRRLVVALHDVAPPFESQIKMQVEALKNARIDVTALMVVPNWHNEHQIVQESSLVEVVGALQADGCEIVLHGYTHQSRAGLRGAPFRVARAKLFAPADAEFMSLDHFSSIRTVRKGLSDLDSIGVSAEAFCAPGWLINDEAQTSLAEAGIKLLVGMMSVQDPLTSGVLWVPSFGYMGAGSLHEGGIRAMGLLTSQLRPRARAVQIYLHPDRSGGRAWMPTVDRAAQMVREGWKPTTYRDIWHSRNV